MEGDGETSEEYCLAGCDAEILCKTYQLLKEDTVYIFTLKQVHTKFHYLSTNLRGVIPDVRNIQG
jgi:hypothetical protein